MASAAEQLAQSFNFGAISKATELKKRLWFTLGALVIYRLGTYIPVPGIDPSTLQQIFQQHSGGILGIFDMFAGGALGRMTIFALNVVPYITSSIIMQLVTPISPQLAALKKEGEAGRKKLNQYTRYGTVVLAAFQSLAIAVGLEGMSGPSGTAVIDPGIYFRVSTVITLTGGTIFLMWLGEQVTQRGVGNGISLIIFSGIVANLPSAMANTLELGRTGAISAGFILLLLFMGIAVIAFIVFVERAQRRVTVQYPKRQMGNKMFGGESSHMPLKVNSAGVIPVIFATSIMYFPALLASVLPPTGWGNAVRNWINDNLLSTTGGGFSPSLWYIALLALLVVFFTYFYTAIQFDPAKQADMIQRQGGYIPGIRPGRATEEYLAYILSRITFPGALYLAIVTVLPSILGWFWGVPVGLSGVSIIIVAGVALETMKQVESQLMMRNYEGFLS